MEICVLFEKDGILALNKPAGICSQGPRTGFFLEVWEMVRNHFDDGHVAHRIDEFTSGINLAGVSRRQLGYLQRNWHQITKKAYLAIAKNPKWDERVIDMPVKGKSAITSFHVLERCGSVALLQCKLVQNGRTHQIRRHLKSAGLPIVGDRKYNGPATTARDGQLLHAWRMEVRLPDETGKRPGEWVAIQAPIPEDFKVYGFNWDRWDEGADGTLKIWPVESRFGATLKTPKKQRSTLVNRAYLALNEEARQAYKDRVFGDVPFNKLLKTVRQMFSSGAFEGPFRQLEPGLIEVPCNIYRLSYIIGQIPQFSS